MAQGESLMRKTMKHSSHMGQRKFAGPTIEEGSAELSSANVKVYQGLEPGGSDLPHTGREKETLTYTKAPASRYKAAPC